MKGLVRLASRALEKVWGTPRTEPWYDNPERRKIGEIWFTASDSVPLLVKFLFTSDRLSVQVHPDDAYAGLHEGSPGKTEMWQILRAEPGSEVGIGLNETLTEDQLREACGNGKIADYLSWVPARVGDTFFVPAGTIHAIGAGLVICEVQQRSDVTYRLHDYGRDRELHIPQAVDVSYRAPYDGRARVTATAGGRELLVNCEYFRTESLLVKGRTLCPSPKKNTLYVAVAGEGTISGNEFHTGEAWEISGGADFIEVASSDATFLVVSF